MSVYLTSFASVVEAGAYAGANAFLSLSPYGQAATVAAVAIPLICGCCKRSAKGSKFSSVSSLPPAPPARIYTWNKKNCGVAFPVILYRAGNKLSYKNFGVPGFRDSDFVPISLPEKASIELCIENLKTLRPVFQKDGSINFTQFCKSLLDGNQEVSRNNWAITLARVGSSKVLEPVSWATSYAGHAVIFIEGIEDGKYFVWMYHITANIQDGADFASPELLKEYKDCLSLINAAKGKSETWLVGIDAAKRMISNIDHEIAAETKAGKPLIPFCRAGAFEEERLVLGKLDDFRARERIGGGGFSVSESDDGDSVTFKSDSPTDGLLGRVESLHMVRATPRADSCMTWAIRKLRKAGIAFPTILNYTFKAVLPRDNLIH